MFGPAVLCAAVTEAWSGITAFFCMRKVNTLRTSCRWLGLWLPGFRISPRLHGALSWLFLQVGTGRWLIVTCYIVQYALVWRQSSQLQIESDRRSSKSSQPGVMSLGHVRSALQVRLYGGRTSHQLLKESSVHCDTPNANALICPLRMTRPRYSRNLHF